MRQLFVFWQFNGDNSSWCNLKCPYCYGGKKKMRHYWQNNLIQWEEAFIRLDREHGGNGIYFTMSYGESLGGRGFYECADMIGRHPSWTLCIVTNWMLDPTKLLQSRLAKEGRLFVIATWHPLGVSDRKEGWEVFKSHLLQAKAANVPIHVMYCWYKPQIAWFPEYFDWLDANGFRVSVRKFIGSNGGVRGKIERIFNLANIPELTALEQEYLNVSTCPKVTEYRVKPNPSSSRGKLCSAGKDMVLVKYNGEASLCADLCNNYIGNIFSSGFKLRDNFAPCPGEMCGGDYGMLHFIDGRFGPLPDRLAMDTFVSMVEDVPQGNPVAYPNRERMLEVLEALKCQK